MEEALLSWEGRCLSQQQLCSLLEVVCEWFLELQWQSGLWRAVELEQRALAWSFTIIRFLEAMGTENPRKHAGQPGTYNGNETLPLTR